MRPARCVALVSALLVGGCSRDEPRPRADAPEIPAEVAVPPALRRVSEVVVARGQCYGRCPIDLMIVRDDGEVIYWGQSYADLEGVHTGWAPLDEVELIAAALLDADYAALAERYASGSTDQATVVTSAVIDGRRIVVSDYGSAGPTVVRTLGTRLERLRRAVEWDPEPLAFDDAAARPRDCESLGVRVARHCEAFVAGVEGSELCALFVQAAERAADGDLPPILCTELLRSLELAPGRAGSGPIGLGPRCGRFVQEMMNGCGDLLRATPLEYDPWCEHLIDWLPRLRDGVANANIRDDDCGAWSRE